MEFPHFFDLPGQVGGLSESSVLRFELIQPAALSSIQPMFASSTKQSFLSETAWAILLHQLVKFTSGKPLDAQIEETLQADGSLVLDAYERSRK
jgi:hypothetical protein